jgi:NhaA family Na+:H+ antiporter
MPMFALANTGLSIDPSTFDAPLVLAIFFAFLLGKPLGVITFSAIAVRFGMADRPTGVSWGMLAAGSVLTGIGFTMALFIAELAFRVQGLESVKAGIVAASIVSAAAGLIALAWLTRTQKAAG